MRVASFVVCVALVMLLAVPSSAQWNFGYQQELGDAFYGGHFPDFHGGLRGRRRR